MSTPCTGEEFQALLPPQRRKICGERFEDSVCAFSSLPTSHPQLIFSPSDEFLIEICLAYFLESW